LQGFGQLDIHNQVNTESILDSLDNSRGVYIREGRKHIGCHKKKKGVVSNYM